MMPNKTIFVERRTKPLGRVRGGGGGGGGGW